MRRRFLRLIPWLLASLLGVLWLQTRHAAEKQDDQLARLRRDNAELRFALKESAAQITDLTAQANELDRELGSAKVKSTATLSRHDALRSDLSAAKQLLAERQQKELALLDELARLRKTNALTTSPAQDEARRHALETQLVDLLTRALLEPAAPSVEPAHQVVKVGPHNTFVVLDYGTAHGARPGEIIQLHRGTTLIAQAQISDRSPRYSVARINPASLKAQLQTGDKIVFTH